MQLDPPGVEREQDGDGEEDRRAERIRSLEILSQVGALLDQTETAVMSGASSFQLRTWSRTGGGSGALIPFDVRDGAALYHPRDILRFLGHEPGKARRDGK